VRRIALFGLTALALAGGVPAGAATTKGPVFGLRAVGNPKLGYFVYTLTPGAARSGAIIVSNVGTASGTVKLFTADGTTGPTSGTVYKTSSAPTGAGTWVHLSQTSFALAPGKHRTVSFAVNVPSGSKPGQWVAGIVAEALHRSTAKQVGKKTRVQITIRDLTIVAVQVNVPGPPVIAFSIGKVTTGGSRGFQKLFIQLTNNGNVLAKPQGSVVITNTKTGQVVETLPFTLDTFLPQTSIDYPLLLKKALTAGDYQATVHLTVPGVSGAPTKVLTSKPTFSVSNADVKQVFSTAQPTQAPPTASTSSSSSSGLPVWVYAAAGAAVIVLLLLLLWLLRRRRGTAAPPMQPETLMRLPPLPPRLDDEAAPAAQPEPEPAPQPDTPSVPPPPPPGPTPAAAAPPPPPPAPAPAAPACDHYWEVAYDRGELGADGVWRFPHRCRSCGLELMARDIGDASAQAANL